MAPLGGWCRERSTVHSSVLDTILWALSRWSSRASLKYVLFSLQQRKRSSSYQVLMDFGWWNLMGHQNEECVIPSHKVGQKISLFHLQTENCNFGAHFTCPFPISPLATNDVLLSIILARSIQAHPSTWAQWRWFGRPHMGTSGSVCLWFMACVLL